MISHIFESKSANAANSDDSLKQRLKEEAGKLGFFEVRVAHADLPPKYGNAIFQWLDNNFHGEMGYMQTTASARAQGAEAVLPGARSVIMFAASYAASGKGTIDASPANSAKIASYALGKDYHFVLKDRLKQLIPMLEELRPGHSWRVCTDSAPLNERAYAAECGIGFTGRNAMIIAKLRGSKFILAEIVTTAEIAPDPPDSGDCGRCTRCIDACPTSAIVGPATVDSRRCISYLTIEKKTPLTDEEAKSTGDWIFGCDICQDVCPYNKRPVESTIPEFAPGTIVNRDEPLNTFLNPASNGQFEKRFKESPILRPGRRRVQILARAKANPHLSPEEVSEAMIPR